MCKWLNKVEIYKLEHFHFFVWRKKLVEKQKLEDIFF